MNTASSLISHISKSVPLTAEDVALISAAFILKKIKKKQIIIQPGFPAPYRNYVVKGAFRAYVIGENGEEHTIQLAIEDWWISDYNAYINRQPATMFVVALEDSTILQTTYDGMEQLKNASNAFKTFLLIRGERTAAFVQKALPHLNDGASVILTSSTVFDKGIANHSVYAASKAAMGQFTPVKRIASGAEIAAASLYLASDASAYMIGAELLIDGGIRTL